MSGSSQGLRLPRCRMCGADLFYSGLRRVWFCGGCDRPLVKC